MRRHNRSVEIPDVEITSVDCSLLFNFVWFENTLIIVIQGQSLCFLDKNLNEIHLTYRICVSLVKVVSII